MNRRRTAVVVTAGIGVVLLVVGGVLGANAYLDAVRKAPTSSSPHTVSKATEAAYRSTVASWPYPLPDGQAYPIRPSGFVVVGQDTVRPFVSFFYQCAWEHAYLDGTAEEKTVAVSNLALWERLPATVSSADNSAGGWRKDVIVPALNGHPEAMKRLYQAGCVGDAYARVVTTASKGLVVSKPAPNVLPAASIRNPCSGQSTAAPCDPNFGPNIVTDSGAREGASGSVAFDGAGVPTSYRVASGDNSNSVAERFGGINLWSLNCYRRSDLNLYAGDTLNLNRYTVATVGTENGKSTSNNRGAAKDCLAQSAIPPQSAGQFVAP